MAAYLDDDFQGYSIGTSVPFGSWTGSGSFVQIFSEPGGTGIPGTDRAFGIFLATAAYDRGLLAGAFLKTFSEFFSSKLSDSQNPQQLVSFVNGPNGLGQRFSLFQVRVEPDGTVTALCPVSGEILGNSVDQLYRFYTYNFLQINVTFSDVVVGGTAKVHILCAIALNGIQVISFSTTVNVAVAQLVNATAEANVFQLNSGSFGAYTLDVLQPIVTYPHPGSPKAIAYQSVVEVDQLLDSGVLKAHQAVTEVDILPDTATLTVFQMVIEVDVLLSGSRRQPEYIHRRHFPGD